MTDERRTERLSRADGATDPILHLAPVAPPTFVPAAAVPPAVPVARGRGGLSVTTLVLALAALFAVGGVAFAAGRVTAAATTTASAGGFGAGSGGFGAGRGTTGNGGSGFGGGNGNGANGFGFGGAAAAAGGAGLTITGTVTAVAADHLALQLAGGQTLDVPIDASTAYHHQASAKPTDVATGTRVEVALPGRFGRGAGNGGAGNGGAALGSSAAPGASGAPRGLGAATDVTITGG